MGLRSCLEERRERPPKRLDLGPVVDHYIGIERVLPSETLVVGFGRIEVSALDARRDVGPFVASAQTKNE